MDSDVLPCQKCNGINSQGRTKAVKITSPQILVISIKRFEQKQTTFEVEGQKITEMITEKLHDPITCDK